MKAVGRITYVSATGQNMVTLHFPNSKGKYIMADYCLGNKEAMPKDAPDFCLFEFDLDDQFCKWIDPNKS